MEAETLAIAAPLRVLLQPLGQPTLRRIRVEQRNEPDLGPLSRELTRHLVRHDAPEGEAANEIGSVRLERAQFAHVLSGHLLDARERRLPAVEPLRL